MSKAAGAQNDARASAQLATATYTGIETTWPKYISSPELIKPTANDSTILIIHAGGQRHCPLL
jgi:hypothetical protein